MMQMDSMHKLSNFLNFYHQFAFSTPIRFSIKKNYIYVILDDMDVIF
jgi:hypothetical protein